MRLHRGGHGDLVVVEQVAGVDPAVGGYRCFGGHRLVEGGFGGDLGCAVLDGFADDVGEVDADADAALEAVDR